MPLSNPIFRRISRLADEQGVQAFVVGGYVRDHYLRRPSTDIDVVVVGSGIALAEALARELKAKVSVFKTFGTAMVRARNVEVEFVGARRESYTRDSRKPEVEPGTLADDQRRRDFTINAMAWSLNGATFGELVDPFDGMSDLEECIIRTPCDPDVTFSDDPLRMMRAVRFASQLVTGDSIPEPSDALIYEDSHASEETLKRLELLEEVDMYCPAWDKVYDRRTGIAMIHEGLSRISKLRRCTEGYRGRMGEESTHRLFELICEESNMAEYKKNPLFMRSVMSDLSRLNQGNLRD